MRIAIVLFLLIATLPGARAIVWPERVYGVAAKLAPGVASEPLRVDTAAAMRMSVEATCALATNRPRLGLSASSWSMSLNNGMRISMCSGEDAFGYDPSRPYTRLTLTLADSIIWQAEIENELFSPRSGAPNTIAIDMAPCGEDGVMSINVEGGYDGLTPLWRGKAHCPLPTEATVSAKGSRLDVVNFVAEISRNPALAMPRYDTQLLEIAMECDNDPRTDVWTRFDYTVNDALARPGGDYCLALIADDNTPGGGYILVYLDGARVNAGRWLPGMVKGRLLPTPFEGRYSLEWYEATFEPATEVRNDASASFSVDDTLLTLEFPLLEATLRFARSR